MFSGSALSGLPIADSGGFLYTAGVADLASVSDFILGVKQQGGIVLGNMSLSDTYAPTGVYNISAFDASTVSEAIYPLGSYANFVNESARAVVIRRVGGGFSSGSMSSGPFSSLGDFTTEISGDEIFSSVNVRSLFTDTASGLDTVLTNAVNNISFTDSAVSSDLSLSNTVSPSMIMVSGVVNEYSVASPIYARSVSELATVSEEITNVVEYGQAIQEAAVSADVASSLVTLLTTIVEDSQASELCSMTLIISPEVNDTITTIDRYSTNIIAQSQLNEMSHAVDVLVARRYWENINTAESAGWKLVQNNIGID